MVTHFRQCTPEDLEILQAFSRKCFFETFAAVNTPENMEAYLDKAYAPEKLRAELSDINSIFYFLYLDEKLAGYLKLNEAPAQTEFHDQEALEIERIYVSQAFQGEGFGRCLMNKAIDTAKEREKKYIWLGVWEKNAKALRFYKKSGFSPIGTHSFMVGDDEQTDILMRKDLEEKP